MKCNATSLLGCIAKNADRNITALDELWNERQLQQSHTSSRSRKIHSLPSSSPLFQFVWCNISHGEFILLIRYLHSNNIKTDYPCHTERTRQSSDKRRDWISPDRYGRKIHSLSSSSSLFQSVWCNISHGEFILLIRYLHSNNIKTDCPCHTDRTSQSSDKRRDWILPDKVAPPPFPPPPNIPPFIQKVVTKLKA